MSPEMEIKQVAPKDGKKIHKRGDELREGVTIVGGGDKKDFDQPKRGVEILDRESK
jgi:hypothetical protein